MPAAPLSKTRLVVRATGIALICLAFTVLFAAGWLALAVSFRGPARRAAWLGQCVFALFRRLGATFIKVGQLMSTRPDVLPEHITRALERLQDNVGPFPFDAVCRIIEAELGRPVGEVFLELAPVPLASASVAQVHKARLFDGRVAAIKVRRPEVAALCDFDLAVMRAGARVLRWWPPWRSINAEAAVVEFGTALKQQLDFRIEAENNVRFRRNFRHHPEIVFPELVPELCTERLLVMSYINGTKVLAVGRTRHDARRIARLGLGALMKMIFEDGFVHADLHPGNMFVTADGRLALVDLGLVGRLDDPHRQSFARFFAAWAQRDGDEMARLMYQLSAGHLADDDAYERYRAAIIGFVGRYWGQRMGEVQVGRVLKDLLGILRQHKIRMDPVFTTVNIAIAVTEGIGKQLDPDLDLMAEALPFFINSQAGLHG